MTLVEVLIALVLLLLSSLAMMQTALVSIQANMKTAARDEAVSLGDAAMLRVRDMPFDDPNLKSYADFCKAVDFNGKPFIECLRNIRNSQVNYTVPMTVKVPVDDINTKQVTVTVKWEWQGEKYTHNLTTILRNF